MYTDPHKWCHKFEMCVLSTTGKRKNNGMGIVHTNMQELRSFSMYVCMYAWKPECASNNAINWVVSVYLRERSNSFANVEMASDISKEPIRRSCVLFVAIQRCFSKKWTISSSTMKTKVWSTMMVREYVSIR